MNNYIRFGEIPNNKKSINYFSNELEKGISVFEIDNNKNILLSNLRLISSLVNRLDTKAYIVTGDAIGIGNDGEPLLNDVKIIEEYKYNKQELVDYIFHTLEKNFYKSEGNRTNELFIGKFLVENKRCKKCGKIITIWEECCGDYEKLEPYEEIVFNSVSFSEPVNGFEIELGYKENN